MDAKTRELVKTIHENKSGTDGICFSPNDQNFVACFADGEVRMWSTESGQLQWKASVAKKARAIW